MSTSIMPDEALALLESEGFEVFVQDTKLIIGLKNRKVRAREVADVVDVEPKRLNQLGKRVQFDFPSA